MEPWKEIVLTALAAALASALITGCLVFVFQSWIGQLFSKQLIRFTKLYETRAKVLAELYKRLVRLQRRLDPLTDGTALGEDFDGMRQDVEREASQLWSFFDDHRLYLETKYCDRLQKQREQVQSILSDLQTASRYAPKEDETSMDQFVETMNRAFDTLMGEVTLTMQGIESDFREMLGVKDRSKSK
jgi:hypothetical protein